MCNRLGQVSDCAQFRSATRRVLICRQLSGEREQGSTAAGPGLACLISVPLSLGTAKWLFWAGVWGCLGQSLTRPRRLWKSHLFLGICTKIRPHDPGWTYYQQWLSFHCVYVDMVTVRHSIWSRVVAWRPPRGFDTYIHDGNEPGRETMAAFQGPCGGASRDTVPCRDKVQERIVNSE